MFLRWMLHPAIHKYHWRLSEKTSGILWNTELKHSTMKLSLRESKADLFFSGISVKRLNYISRSTEAKGKFELLEESLLSLADYVWVLLTWIFLIKACFQPAPGKGLMDYWEQKNQNFLCFSAHKEKVNSEVVHKTLTKLFELQREAWTDMLNWCTCTFLLAQRGSDSINPSIGPWR